MQLPLEDLRLLWKNRKKERKKEKERRKVEESVLGKVKKGRRISNT